MRFNSVRQKIKLISCFCECLISFQFPRSLRTRINLIILKNTLIIFRRSKKNLTYQRLKPASYYVMFPLDFVKYRIILYDRIVHVKNALKQTLRFLLGSLDKNPNTNHLNLFHSKHHLLQSIFKKNILLKIKPDTNFLLVLTCYDKLRKILRLLFTTLPNLLSCH